MKALSIYSPIFNDLYDEIQYPSWDIMEKSSRNDSAKVETTEDGARILIPFPGLSPGDVDITMKDGVLKISVIEPNEDRHFSYRSYSYNITGFSEDISATMKDGLLTVALRNAKKEIDEGKKIKVLEA